MADPISSTQNEIYTSHSQLNRLSGFILEEADAVISKYFSRLKHLNYPLSVCYSIPLLHHIGSAVKVERTFVDRQGLGCNHKLD